MRMAAAVNPASQAVQRSSFDRRLEELESLPAATPATLAAEEFVRLHTDIEPFVVSLKHRMLTSAFPWTDEDRANAEWIYATHHRLARVAHAATEASAPTHPAATLQLAAHTLFYMGEAVKCEIAVGAQKPHDYAGLHAIMRWAISARCERTVTSIDLDAAPANCTLEGLYFRALLLADFAGGNMTCKQIEILDAWMLMWMPALKSVRVAPPGSPRRADLDSSAGLRRGPRADGGPSLYLPQAPIERAYRAVIESLHQGRILPEKGLASELRIEEHVAVLDLIRGALGRSRDEYVPRQDRRPTSAIVEAHVGLAEIVKSAFSPEAATDSTAMALETVRAISAGSARGASFNEGIFDRKRRLLQLVNASESGLGLEAIHAPCEEIAVGDLLAVRPGSRSPLAIGKVSRRLPTPDHGGCSLGVSILTKAAQRVTLSPQAGAKDPTPFPAIYVPGEDDSGRHDGFLVSEREFSESGPLAVNVNGTVVTLRFNRVRDKGRNWVLGGFEILDSRAAS